MCTLVYVRLGSYLLLLIRDLLTLRTARLLGLGASGSSSTALVSC